MAMISGRVSGVKALVRSLLGRGCYEVEHSLQLGKVRIRTCMYQIQSIPALFCIRLQIYPKIFPLPKKIIGLLFDLTIIYSHYAPCCKYSRLINKLTMVI